MESFAKDSVWRNKKVYRWLDNQDKLKSRIDGERENLPEQAEFDFSGHFEKVKTKKKFAFFKLNAQTGDAFNFYLQIQFQIPFVTNMGIKSDKKWDSHYEFRFNI